MQKHVVNASGNLDKRILLKGNTNNKIVYLYYKLDILSKKSIAQSLSASIINGHKLHMSNEIAGEKNVI